MKRFVNFLDLLLFEIWSLPLFIPLGLVIAWVLMAIFFPPGLLVLLFLHLLFEFLPRLSGSRGTISQAWRESTYAKVVRPGRVDRWYQEPRVTLEKCKSRWGAVIVVNQD